MTERGITDPTDLAFQRGDWRRERIGWALMTLLVVAAVLGLFGEGLLSSRTVGGGTVFALTHERTARRQDRTEVLVELDLAALDGDTAELRISASYLDDVDVELVTPEPASTLATDQGLVYEFDLDPEATSGTARLRFTVRPDTVGVASGEVELVGHSTHSIRQFVFP